MCSNEQGFLLQICTLVINHDNLNFRVELIAVIFFMHSSVDFFSALVAALKLLDFVSFIL